MDRLDDLPEGNSQDDPMMDEFFEKPKDVKRSWKDYLKLLGMAMVAFGLAANPFTALFLSKVSFFQGAYKNFFGMAALFFVVFGAFLWYF